MQHTLSVRQIVKNNARFAIVYGERKMSNIQYLEGGGFTKCLEGGGEVVLVIVFINLSLTYILGIIISLFLFLNN